MSEQDWRERAASWPEGWRERDAALAREMGLDRPYVSGERAGQCPGGASYGHGLTATSVHLGCCARWDEARAAREAERQAEAG